MTKQTETEKTQAEKTRTMSVAAIEAPQGQLTDEQLSDVVGGIIIIGGINRFSTQAVELQSFSWG
jgi:hypothetical protein